MKRAFQWLVLFVSVFLLGYMIGFGSGQASVYEKLRNEKEVYEWDR